MAIDFRPPEERGIPAPKRASAPVAHSAASPTSAASAAAPPAPAAAARRLILVVLHMAALGFILAGVAVLLLRPPLLGPEVSLYVGAALVLAGLFDVVAAQLLKAIWVRAQQGQQGPRRR